MARTSNLLTHGSLRNLTYCCRARFRTGALALAALLLASALTATPALAVLNCQDDIDGANDQPGQKDITQFCGELGNGSPYELVTSINWDNTTLSGNNTADLCFLFNSDSNMDVFANFATCVTLKSSGAGNGNLAVLQEVRLFTCADTSADRCDSAVLIGGSPNTQCTVSQQSTDPFVAGDAYPVDTEILCSLDLDDFGAGSGTLLVDTCSYPSNVPNSAPSDCVRFSTCTGNTDCDDGNPCTIDTCTSGLFCAYTPDPGEACTDGLFCTGTEICNSLGLCEADTPVDCDDQVDCTSDSCDEASDSCLHAPSDAFCDDGQFCNGDETCNAQSGCQDEDDPDCDDGVACTDDSCDEAFDQCDHTPNNGSCSDGLFCTGVEICDPIDGCEPGTDPCPGSQCNEATDQCVNCLTDADCNNSVFCDGAEVCNTVTGICGPGTPPNCDDGIDCTFDTCNESSDACDHSPSDAACDDGQFCNGSETCNAQTGCQDGADPDCSDGVSCTVDTCNETTDDCDHTPDDSFCDDAQFCTTGESCDPVNDCQPGSPTNCSDGVDCTIDTCSETTDACDHEAVNAACDDSLFCNGSETCDLVEGCQAGTAPDCDDGVGCTVDACNEEFDQCDNTPDNDACTDGLFCTGVEICDPEDDCQPGSDPCPDILCNESLDQCVDCLTDADCDNSVFCDGTETCNTGTGVCLAGTPPDCNDLIDCTFDACNEGTDGCDHTPNDAACSDELFCNGAETCDAESGCQPSTDPCAAGGECNDACDEEFDLCADSSGTPCTDDGNVCTNDECDGQGACIHPDNVVGCDDGLFCTATDQCSGGSCVGSGDPCTGGTECNDACDEVGDTCADPFGTSCTEDQNVCTADICDGEGDCVHSNVSGPCDDGLFCTANDTCIGALCTGSGDPCASGGECNDACNEGNDNCLTLPDTPCSADENVCTDDVCDGEGACAHPANSAPCDDGLACTEVDQCQNGACVGGLPPECADGNPCTQDSCDDILGCINSDEPQTDCFTAQRTRLAVNNRPDNKKDRLKWAWRKGDTTTMDDLGSPPDATSYTLCIYDTDGGLASETTQLYVPPSGSWSKAGKKGWKYKDKSLAYDGVQRERLKTGPGPKSKASLKAKGATMPTPTPVGGGQMFLADPSVIVQLLNDEAGGKCWTSEMTTIRKNTEIKFRAKSP
jgi:hypothetical protein